MIRSQEILTNRNRLSEDILSEVKESAVTYGVRIGRADVKGLFFPGNLREIMNRVLGAERDSEAQLVLARTKAELQRIEAQTHAQSHGSEAETRSEVAALKAREQAAKA